MPDRTDAVIAATVVLLLALSAVGCGPTAVQGHYRAQTLTAAALTVGGEVVTDARRGSLQRVEESTVGQPTAERIAALNVERARWEPVGASLDTARSALLTWVSATETAQAAGEDADLMGVLVRLAARVVLLYDEAARLSHALGVDLPELPEVARQLARSVGEGQ